MKVAVFDLDGTLFEARPSLYDSGRLGPPLIMRLHKVRAMIKQGWQVYFLTGREAQHAENLQCQLDFHRLQGAKGLFTQPKWISQAEMRRYKAAALALLHPDFFVGDQDADRLAAEDANVQFIHANDWLSTQFAEAA